jgi:glycosyltransferase 2 family protein
MSRSEVDGARVRRKAWWDLFLRAAVLAAALVFLGRGVEWHDIASAVKRAGVLVPAIVVALNACMMSLRALRLRVLLQQRLSFASAFTALLTSSALNNITPFRGGHVARLWMLERAAGVTKSFALAITLIENLLEIAVLAVLGFAASWLITGQRWAAVATPVVFLATVALLVLLQATTGRAAPQQPPQSGWLSKTRRWVVRLGPGFRALSEPGIPGRVVLLSLLAWTCEAIMIVLGAHSMGLEVSLPLAVIVLVGINLALTLPSTPAGAGPFEGATVAVLILAGIAKGPAVAFAFFYHAIQVVPVTLAGAAVILLVRRRQARKGNPARAESAAAPPVIWNNSDKPAAPRGVTP